MSTKSNPLPEFTKVLGLQKGIDFSIPEDYSDDALTRKTTTDLAEAQVIISRIGDTNRHKPVLDIDFPAHLQPSSTPGHYHLYLDKELTWDKYQRLIVALADAGIIEDGYASASMARKYTATRLPWIKKDTEPSERERG